MTPKEQQINHRLRTGDLCNALVKTTSLSGFFKRNEDSFINDEFAAYLDKLTKEKDMVREHVIKRADIDRSYGHQIYEGRRRPARDKVIQLSFGLGLNEDDTQTLLKVAGYSPLYPRMKRDAVILYAIHKGLDLIGAQTLLDQEGYTLLGKS